tara:strand:+ start:195 stop:944 length:750 start_codon:yes stop_codon:yes gene_type:complete
MEVILDSTEETSISIDGDFEKNSYSKNVKKSFFQALAMDTKLSNEIKFMPGMSGKKYRYFINNFVSITENPRYLEIGSWTGSTVCSALYGNVAKAVCIDNWLTFPEEKQVRKFFNTENQKETFEKNIKKVITKKIDFKFIESDFRKVNFNKLGKFNIYCYDALHDLKSQYNGITIVQPALDNIFILVVDDWNLKEVRNGTFKAFKDLGITVSSRIEIKTTQNDTYPKLVHSHYSDWHSGYFIAVCEKPK